MRSGRVFDFIRKILKRDSEEQATFDNNKTKRSKSLIAMDRYVVAKEHLEMNGTTALSMYYIPIFGHVTDVP